MSKEEQQPIVQLAPGTPARPPESGFYEAYSGFAKTLRTWLIAFGVGAPIIFFQSPEAWAALGKNGAVRPFVYCFLIGIAIQVFCSLLFKTAMWYLYMSELGEIQEDAWQFTASQWVSTAYWLELFLDVATISLFTYATFRAVQTVVA